MAKKKGYPGSMIHPLILQPGAYARNVKVSGRFRVMMAVIQETVRDVRVAVKNPTFLDKLNHVQV